MVVRMNDFQISKRKAIHHQVVILRNVLYFGNVLNESMMGVFY